MPDMDGYETAQLMRSAERTRIVPIIFVTAGDRSEERMFAGYEVGAVDFLYKPVNPAILESKVGVFVELHRKSRELAAANAALERASRALAERVADVESVNRTLSHDLRAPLRSIHGFAKMLAEGGGEDHLRRILGACGRMERMLDGLHELLRISGTERTFEDVDCEGLLTGVTEDLRADIERAGAEIARGPLPMLRGNRTLLALLLQNLIANALKFRGPAPPRVTVSAERSGGEWRFQVTDNGVGIPPESRARVFEVFARLVGDATPGTGVGLALCKQAVDKHGGRIWVEGGAGGGATFCFTIPA